jgi:PD-(D/E)XK nuclease superfamily
MYEVLKKRTCSRATEIALIAQKRRLSTTSYGRSRTGFEVWVESRDKAVGGLIDTVQRIGNQIVLSDYKTGDVLEPPEGMTGLRVKESYAVQLKLYAALYQQTFRVWPARLQVVPLTGATHDVPFTETECTKTLAEASRALRTLNARITDGPQRHAGFANPSPLICRFCTFRPACHAYRGAPRKANQKWPLDAFGQVWDINALRDGRISLRVNTNAGKNVIFRALSISRHPVLKTVQRGEQIGIFNAHPSAGKEDFSEGPLTVLCKFASSFLAEQ